MTPAKRLSRPATNCWTSLLTSTCSRRAPASSPPPHEVSPRSSRRTPCPARGRLSFPVRRIPNGEERPVAIAGRCQHDAALEGFRPETEFRCNLKDAFESIADPLRCCSRRLHLPILDQIIPLYLTACEV